MSFNSASKHHPHERGFTLVEMALVLFIVASVLLAALPNLKTLGRSNRVNDASRQVQAALQLARMKAINEGKDQVVQFTASGWNVFVDLDRDGVRDNDEKWLYSAAIALPPGVRYMSPPITNGSEELPQIATTGCKCARWQPNGTMRVSSNTITNLAVAVGNGFDYRQLAVTVAGAIKLQRWNAELSRWE